MAEWAADLPGKLTIDIKGAGGCSISEGGSMANLITGGLSIALMSADSSAKAALKPMNMVSRELHKRNPDLELIERAGTYGGMKLDQAEESLEKAREELKEAQEAARTGHTVLTTTHASSTHGIYSRLATLCLQKYAEVPYDIIISLVAEAFPLGIYMKQLEDGSRRLMEIAECVLTGHGEYTTRSLYRFDIVSEERNTDGSIDID